jgi:hypothetical protein
MNSRCYSMSHRALPGIVPMSAQVDSLLCRAGKNNIFYHKDMRFIIQSILNDQRSFIAVINSIINPNFKAFFMKCFLKFMNIIFIFVALADENVSHRNRRKIRIL